MGIGARALGCAVMLALSGCGGPEVGPDGKVLANPNAAPGNYRQIVALKLATVYNSGGITSAEISQPAETWMGIQRGGMLPAVCATVVHKDIRRSNYIFTFRKGQLDETIAEPGAIYCMGRQMSALTELTSRR